MSDLSWIASNTVIVAAPTTRNGDHELRWEHAVRCLPSIDTPALHAWLDTHHFLEVIVVPSLWCPPSALTAPHREICVPPSEYALFTAALSTALAGTTPRGIPVPLGSWLPPITKEFEHTMSRAPIQWERAQQETCTIVSPSGVLNARSYRQFADDLLKFATAEDEPRALIVIVDGLRIDTEPALTVFTRVADRLQDWPGIPPAAGGARRHGPPVPHAPLARQFRASSFLAP